MPPSMTVDERQAFLHDVHVALLAIESADGPPVVAPIWYAYEPGGDVKFMTGPATVKGRALTAAGRASLCVQSEDPAGYRYVTVDGPVTGQGPASEDERRELAVRYLGPTQGEQYLQATVGMGEVVFTLRPDRWRTADFTKAF